MTIKSNDVGIMELLALRGHFLYPQQDGRYHTNPIDNLACHDRIDSHRSAHRKVGRGKRHQYLPFR